MAALAWPSIRWVTFTFAPELIANEAAVCRRSWAVTRGKVGSGGFFAWLIAAMFVFFVVAWPYLLGTYIAVQLGAGNPSTARAVVGRFFEVLYVGGLIGWYVLTSEKRAQKTREEAQRHADLVASGVVYQTQVGRTIAHRHGACTVNHRSHATAEKCPNG